LSDGFLQYAISPHNTLTTKLTGLRLLNLRGTGQRTIARLRSSSLSSSGMSDVSANAGDQLHIEHTSEFVTQGFR